MKLNKKQLEAAHHINGPLLILAGAGSGKTTVLSHRINHMVNDGIEPKNLLCVTFTNKAVNELKNRIQNKIGYDKSEKTYVSTFHALGLDILKSNWNNKFSVSHTHQSRQLVKTIIDELEIENNDTKDFLKPSSIMKVISLFKSELVYPSFLLNGKALKEFIDAKKIKQILADEIKTKENFSVFKQIYSTYQKRLSEQNLIDVDDILLFAVKLLTDNPSKLNELQERFKYIMVDEYQDTNRSQYILIKLLASKHNNLAVVGDDFQSIYKFRGSDIRNILNFINDYPKALEVLLEENYRSTKTILSAANEIIKNNPDQKEKTLYTNQEIGEKIHFHEANLAIDEAEFISEQIKKLINDGYHYKDIAIFYRNNADSSMFETVLPNQNIPFAISKDTSFFDRKEIKDILSYLQFIIDSKDSYLFSQIVNQPKRGVGVTSMKKLVHNSKGEDLIDYCKKQNDVKLNKNASKGINSFINLIEKYKDLETKTPTYQLIEQLIDDIDYKSTFDGLETYLKKEKEDYLNKLIEVAKEMESKKNTTMHLSEFIKELLKTDVDSTMDEEEFNKVNLSTIHSAKGLEFPIVFIAGMKEEGFPSKFATTIKSIEEERRLCYVAFTRAKKRLFLSYPKKSLVKDEKNPKEKLEISNKKSRFLNEFNQDLIKKI